MDPFSLTVGIAGLTGLVATSIAFARNYLSAVKNGKESIRILVTELEALQGNLTNLDAFLKSASAKDLTFEPTSVLRSCTMSCEASLKTLCKKLGQVGESKTSRYLWPLSENEHQKTMQDLRNFARWIQFALSIDGCSLLSRTSDDVLKVLEGQLKNFNTLQTLEKTTSQLNEAVQYQSQMVEDDKIARVKDLILSWISETDSEQKHHSVRQPRVKGTGGWLLDRKEFLSWRDGTAVSNVLWCHGLQGSGKSVLTSMVIDYFRGSRTKISVAFFYFDYQDEDRQSPAFVLSSILRQLVATLSEIPQSISDAYEKHQKSGTSCSLEELEQLMRDVLKIVDQSVIIIDALDECDKSRHRKPFLQILRRLQQIQNLRVFVTSRQNFQDIMVAFNSHPQIAITAHNFDLQCYMRQEMELAGLDEIVDASFANTIIKAVIAKAQGMFLLAILHFQTVLKEPTAGAIEDAVASLSPSLDSAFEKTIQRIQRLPESRRRLGIEILMWISHAKRPLDVEELSDALSVKPGQTTVNPKYRPSPSIMLECCQGLVTIDPNAARIHLAHYSIQEYLVKHSESLFPDAEIYLGTISLTYLMFEDFRTGPLEYEEDIEHRIEKHPFSTYAAQFWGVHMRGTDLAKGAKDLILTYLDSQEAIGSGIQIFEYNRGHKEMYWDVEESMSYTALHICSQFGLDELLLDRLDQGNLSINAGTEMGTTPIIKAASRGFVSTVKILLDRGADPYLENWYGNALHCAAEAGNCATIKELVAYGMSPNACEQYLRNPLRCTIDNDHADAFKTLIMLGADINVIELCSSSELPTLHQIVAYDALNIMDDVLKHRWGDLERKTKEGHTALHYAAFERNSFMWQKLIEAGAKPDVRDGRGITPLQYLAHEALGRPQALEDLYHHDGECVHSWKECDRHPHCQKDI